MTKIYHYTKLSTAIDFILPTMSLRTNFLNHMNGPKENQTWHFGGMNVPYDTLYPELDYLNEPDRAHFAGVYKFGEEIKSKIQALCFSHSESCNGYGNEMMWAHYADNHRGVCMELDFEIFEQENQGIKTFKFENINYNPKKDEWVFWDKNLTKNENMKQYIDRNYKVLLLSKSHYWEKEHEKRLLIIADGFQHLTIKKSLTGIYYGLSTSHYYDIAVRQFIDPNITKLYRVHFENNKLKRI